ncbi:ergothioneine biosynthesis protein EgtC [Nocardiopsis ansamitocini]|uniref:Gamma-glutamyl-hercynylcysteine sulfoxide hydrolase n=1 Tax=Nocardiopsis ansamitocini TaxID=1670832 RepID=A0A9W6P662_9ACTN|nr:ergothioneine biosynthesis protein EgtC [Nocardiopsis ansamitocini]GLU47861.1 gamma-glutamyl-hercynylcysteine sulfoxide hydrolase [Nocardiopsis ansamitocini]
MCRHLAYLGPARTLHELLYATPHSLHTQSYAPREQRHGSVNADGFGVGWYHPDRAEPVRYRRAMPIWADASFADVARVTRSTCVVAAVRDATVGFAVDESCAQPLRADTWLFSHNGAVADYEAVADVVGLPLPSGALEARAPVDSAPLFAMAVRLWRKGEELGSALAAVVAAARAVSPGRYNLLASDGHTLAATVAGDTLYLRSDGESVLVASEPLDDASGWERVPDNSVLTASATGHHVVPIR